MDRSALAFVAPSMLVPRRAGIMRLLVSAGAQWRGATRVGLVRAEVSLTRDKPLVRPVACTAHFNNMYTGLGIPAISSACVDRPTEASGG